MEKLQKNPFYVNSYLLYQKQFLINFNYRNKILKNEIYIYLWKKETRR